MRVTYIIPDTDRLIDKILAYLRGKGYDTKSMGRDEFLELAQEYRGEPDYPDARSCARITISGIVIGQYNDSFFVALEDGRIVRVPIEGCYVDSY